MATKNEELQEVSPGITPAQIAKLEKKFENIKVIEIYEDYNEIELTEKNIEGKEKVGDIRRIGIGKPRLAVLKKPSRATVTFAYTKMTNSKGAIDTISPGDVLVKNCWIGGDEDLKKDDGTYFRLCIEATGYLSEIMGFI